MLLPQAVIGPASLAVYESVADPRCLLFRSKTSQGLGGGGWEEFIYNVSPPHFLICQNIVVAEAEK